MIVATCMYNCNRRLPKSEHRVVVGVVELVAFIYCLDRAYSMVRGHTTFWSRLADNVQMLLLLLLLLLTPAADG